MAFQLNGFVRLASIGAVGSGANATKALCTYHTNDDAAAVEAAGYFDNLAKDLAKGDFIMAGLDIDGTPQLKNYIVTTIAAGVVTIAAQTTA
ncbi:hypothetical protein [Cohaesibacter gelatinilyticus]|uniref:Uncharacterized protein n=1 Tax=Cohaesibacter gelatinilyticus TaxID=372072 RepID=A0A285PGV4_9HYPH|nr:hypothetical protein [Cohaesibacter gelatinilyticus]SNZ20949.1 hypothetical protein SAMN06265368_4063 [Cohaesibacter gelatinilyticus]